MNSTRTTRTTRTILTLTFLAAFGAGLYPSAATVPAQAEEAVQSSYALAIGGMT